MLPMKIVEMLKNRNRTLLEVNTGALFWAAIALTVGMLLPLQSWGISRLDWCLCICVAALLVVISVIHMQRCLDRALDFDEGTATKLIFRGYLIRYVSFAAVLITAALTAIVNPLILCLGYLLMMKMAVYSQPLTHKLYNKLFHETDPIPEPIEEQNEKGF